MKSRLFYFFAVTAIIILGILSRKIPGIPLFTGDALYAVMVYTGLRFLFLKSLRFTAVAALLICVLIELSQLLRWDWLVALRRTTLGHYALGEGFLYSDLLAYFIGIGVAFLTDIIAYKKAESKSLGS